MDAPAEQARRDQEHDQNLEEARHHAPSLSALSAEDAVYPWNATDHLWFSPRNPIRMPWATTLWSHQKNVLRFK
jgi:hypothetical protein